MGRYTPDSTAGPHCEMGSQFLAQAASSAENDPRPTCASGREEHLKIDVFGNSKSDRKIRVFFFAI